MLNKANKSYYLKGTMGKTKLKHIYPHLAAIGESMTLPGMGSLRKYKQRGGNLSLHYDYPKGETEKF